MSSPTKRSNKTRAGVVLLSVLALVGTGAVAWGHGAPAASIPDADGTIHACFPTNGTRTLRVVAPTQTCAANQSGVDWAVTGVLTRLEESGPPALPLTLPPGPGQIGSMNLSCPAGKVATGIAAFTTTAPTAPAALVGMSRSGTPHGNVLTVTFANILNAAATVSDLTAICVRLFA